MKSVFWKNFCHHRRAFWSLWIFLFLFLLSCTAPFLCNTRPLVVYYKKQCFFPICFYYPETRFGGQFDLEMDYQRDLFQEALRSEQGWALWPPLPYDSSTINMDISSPSPPSWKNWLGTDDQGRDVFTRLLYGLRTSLFFGLTLACLSTSLGIFAGAMQGYFGGWVDLIMQRIIEIWSGLPLLFLMMIFTSLLEPGLGWLLVVMVLFKWTQSVGMVRAEFLRARQYTYVRAAYGMGAHPLTIVLRHILPNALAVPLSIFPFLVSSSISTLTALDFLGFGLPPGSPSLGDLLQQAKTNLYAPWLGITAFLSISILLLLINFIGEGVRETFDPRSYGKNQRFKSA